MRKLFRLALVLLRYRGTGKPMAYTFDEDPD